ncbi:hypothetical protein ACIRQP_14775 [Streptomyces sp. NPDC102274]|uniref:hypothetical protein n=1 Tax=Streptomyces sp. NPDC102274 TaxID=3366151 RepID=UPI0038116C22
MPWISRTRLADMRARIEQLAEQRDEARTDARRAFGASARLAGGTLELDEQVADLRSRLTAAQQDLTAEKRRADRLQQRLDDAVGINGPAVDSGAMWQQRRADKPITVKGEQR